MAKDAQAEMITIGLQDEGGMIDEASGNEVPNGALKEEVRDDQPAMLSPGEFVIPAYAVRYFGVERFVKMLRAAKQGMEQLDDMGLTGEPNADDASLETAMLPTEVDKDVSQFQVGGYQPGGVTRKKLTLPEYTSPVVAAATTPAVAPSPVTAIAPPTAPVRPAAQQNVTYPQYVYSPQGGTGYGVAEYVGPNGQAIFVTTIGGKPISKIPEGFKTRAQYNKDLETDKSAAPPSELERKPEDMDPGSFEASEGEDAGGKDLTPSQMDALTTFGYGTGTGGAAATAALGVLGGPLGLFGSILSFFGGEVARNFARSTVSKQIARQSQNSSKPPPLDKIFTKEEAEKWNKGSMSKEDIAAVQETQTGNDAKAAGIGGRAIDAAQAKADAIANDPASTSSEISAAQDAVIDAAEEAAGQQGISIGDYDTGSSDAEADASSDMDAVNVSMPNKGGFIKKKTRKRKPKGKGLASSM